MRLSFRTGAGVTSIDAFALLAEAVDNEQVALVEEEGEAVLGKS